MLKTSMSSSGRPGYPSRRASGSPLGSGLRQPVNATARLASPSVIVRGVAWRKRRPTAKSSRKLPNAIRAASNRSADQRLFEKPARDHLESKRLLGPLEDRQDAGVYPVSADRCFLGITHAAVDL